MISEVFLFVFVFFAVCKSAKRSANTTLSVQAGFVPFKCHTNFT